MRLMRILVYEINEIQKKIKILKYKKIISKVIKLLEWDAQYDK